MSGSKRIIIAEITQGGAKGQALIDALGALNKADQPSSMSGGKK